MAPHPAPPEPAPPDADSPEDRFSSVLADWDERLAAGGPDPAGPSGAPPDQGDRLARAVACVRLLRAALPGPPPGRRLGDFEVGRELGRGGMGVVYEARQVSLNRLVALKVLGGAAGLTGTAVARFRREAETAARLHHTNIVPIHATGEAGGVHYYAMELVAGPSLDRVLGELRRGSGAGPLTLLKPAAGPAPTGAARHDPTEPGPPAGSSLGSDGRYFDTVARLVAEVADALHYAHLNGVIHRDIKPSNLLLSPDDRLRVNDFGLARLLEEPGMTVSGEFVGTPAYMPPEQIAAGRAVDRRTDVYALGATLYELLTLRPPFAGESRAEVLTQVLQNDPAPPRRVNPRVPRDLETVCLKALEKGPARRYPSAAEFAADLRRFLAGEPVTARRVGALGRVWKHARRRPVVAGLLAAVVVLTLGGAGAVTVLWRQAESALAGERIARRDEAAAREKAEAELAAKLVLLARIEWEAAHIATAAGHLAECPPWHRGPEWRYLDRMCRAEVLPPIRQPVDGPSRVAFSPDGKWLATVTPKELRVWDAASRAQVFGAGVVPHRFAWLGFTPDDGRGVVVLSVVLPGAPPSARPPAQVGQLPGAVVASPNATWRFTIWDAASGRVVRQSQLVAPYHEGVARSPAGPLLATMNAATIRVRDLASDQVTVFAHGHRVVRFLEFNANGRHLLSTAPGEPIKVWDASTGRLVATVAGERLPGGVYEHDRQLLSPDGRWLLRFRSGEYSTTRTQVWDVENGREQTTFLGPAFSVNNARFSPDGRCLALVLGNAVHVRDLTTGRETHVLRGHTTPVVAIAFAPNGTRLASISMDQTVREWDVSPYED
jgi:eukaryotic-like serine/threonine-protein kinase